MAVNYSTIKSMKTAKIGTIMPWAGDGNDGFALSNLPKGWITCDGLLKPAARYPLLVAQIGDTYGASDDFGGDFPDYEGSFRVPNMTLKMPIDLEPEYLFKTKYQYGAIDAYQQLVGSPFDGAPLIGGFGSISLTTPIVTNISAQCDIDFTVDASLVMVGKMTNITIAPPDFSTTVYTINRKLGINHTPSHAHPGTYSRATAQFSGPQPFEPPTLVTGGPVAGSCGSFGYSECQLSDNATASSWQSGANSITYYGDEQHEYTLPVTDKFYIFQGSQYWSQVPAQSWPPVEPHPSGLTAANDLNYTYFGSNYTEQFDTAPVKNHAQPAWTGVFPKPMSAGNRRNHFGGLTYNPDSSPPFQVSGVTIPATSTTVSLPAGTDIGDDLDAIVPFMWVYSDSSASSTATAGSLKTDGILLYEDVDKAAAYYPKALNEWAYVNLGQDEGIWTNMNQYIEQNVVMGGGSGTGMVLKMRFEPWGPTEGQGGGTGSTGGLSATGFELYEDPSSPEGNNPNSDVTSSGFYSRALDEWAYIDDGSGGQYWNDDDDFVEVNAPVTGGSGSDAILKVRIEAWPQPFEGLGEIDTFELRWSARFVNQSTGQLDATGNSNPDATGEGTWVESQINDWSYRVANAGDWTSASDTPITETLNMIYQDSGSGTGFNVDIEYAPHEVSGTIYTKIRITGINSVGSGYQANEVLTTNTWNNADGTADRILRVKTVEGGYPGNTRYKIIEIVSPGYGYQSNDEIGFEFNTTRRAQLGLGSVTLNPAGATGAFKVTTTGDGSGPTVPENTRYKVISIANAGSGYLNGEELDFDNTIFNPDTNQFDNYFKISSSGTYVGGEVLATSNSMRPGTTITAISREGTSDADYVYTLQLSQATLNETVLVNQVLNFKHGTYPTSLNNITSQLDPNGATFIGHNHGSFEISQGQGSLAAPTVHPINDISLGDVSPENINDALSIVADTAMPALVTTFIIKAY